MIDKEINNINEYKVKNVNTFPNGNYLYIRRYFAHENIVSICICIFAIDVKIVFIHY